MYFRIVFRILKDAKLGWISLTFLAIFAICCVIIGLTEPSIRGGGDIAWMCFQAVTTIGYGDVVPTAPIPRIAIVVLSIASVFYLAIITGTVVYYCNEIVRLRHKASLAAIQDKLEHLPDLSKDELESLSQTIRKIKAS